MKDKKWIFKPLPAAFTALICVAFASGVIWFHYQTPSNRLYFPATPNTQQQPIPTKHIKITVVRIKANDTFTAALQRAGIKDKLINAIIYQKSKKISLPILKPSNHITIIGTEKKPAAKIQYQLNSFQTWQLDLAHTQSGYRSKIITAKQTPILNFKAGTIHSSFSNGAIAAGLNYQLISQFETIFQGKINFRKNVRPDDRFNVLYNEIYIDGKKSHSGKIQLAQYIHHHHKYTAVRFTAPNHQSGYYNLQGKGMEPLFLPVALHYKRISSPFSLHRLDPIAHKIQPHYGVDYAAPRGTPIHSVGNGTIIFKGRDQGYGNAIKIAYGKHIVSLYAHMSRFAHVRGGERVKKGQIIGYVGMTGWATGPHLHFGWYVNGIPKDPLKRKTFYNPPIARQYKNMFLAHTNELVKEERVLSR
jgi:murein DD-endopeptidase MepM/ murein hydrolase activator NlpD